MRWGFSKSLGGGFRVGIGGRIGGSRRRSGPTQRELALQEKQQFLDNTKTQFEELLTQWFLCQGHLVMPKDALKPDSPIAIKVRPLVEVFNNSQRLVRDGGSLTAKRREAMLEAIYALEKFVDELEITHPLVGRYEDFMSAVSRGTIAIMFAAGFLIFGLFLHGFLVIAVTVGVWGFYQYSVAGKLKEEAVKSAEIVVSEL